MDRKPNPHFDIFKLVELCHAGAITLTAAPPKKAVSGAQQAPAPTKPEEQAYFFNYTDPTGTTFGNIHIDIGNPDKDDSLAPTLLRQPTPFEDASGKKNPKATIACLVSINDPAEQEAFAEFNKWYLNKIYETDVIKSRRPGERVSRDVFEDKVPAFVGLPDGHPDAPAKNNPESKRSHFTVRPRLVVDREAKYPTDCRLLKRPRDPASKVKWVDIKNKTFDPLQQRAGTKCYFTVELAQLSQTPQKVFCAMPYIRIMRIKKPQTSAEPSTSRIGDTEIGVEADDEDDGVSGGGAGSDGGAGYDGGAGAADDGDGFVAYPPGYGTGFAATATGTAAAVGSDLAAFDSAVDSFAAAVSGGVAPSAAPATAAVATAQEPLPKPSKERKRFRDEDIKHPDDL